jgi:hypothetical protein
MCETWVCTVLRDRNSGGQREPCQHRQERIPLRHVLREPGVKALRQHRQRLTRLASPLRGQRLRQVQAMGSWPVKRKVDHLGRHGRKVLSRGPHHATL